MSVLFGAQRFRQGLNNMKKMIILAVLAIVGAGGGFAIFKFLGLDSAPKATAESAAPKEGETGEAGGLGDMAADKILTGTRYVFFDRMVMNLHDPALVKYLSIEIVLEVEARDEAEVIRLIEKKKPQLKDSLTTLIADKTLEDVVGRVGINALKREVHKEFNEILFPDGIHKVNGVLFDEWHID